METTVLYVRVPESVKSRLNQIALRSGMSLTAVVSRLLGDAVGFETTSVFDEALAEVSARD
jgi:hypothetical protein